MIYAKNAGTSWPKPPEVLEAVGDALALSPHEMDGFFESARPTVCDFLGITHQERFLFAPGCISALMTAITDLPWSAGDAVLTSSLEHHALVRPIELLRERGVEHVQAPYRPGEPVDLEFVHQTLAGGRVRLVAMTHESNVTGEILPLMEPSRLAHDYEALFLVDAAQTVGVEEIGADILTFAGHEGRLGLQGIGGLWAAEHVIFESPLAVCEIEERKGGKPCAPIPGYCDLGSLNMAAAGLAAGIRRLETLGGVHLELAALLRAELRRRSFCRVFGAPKADFTATVSL